MSRSVLATAATFAAAALAATTFALVPAAAAAQCPAGRASVIAVPPPGATQEVILEGRATYLGRIIDDGDPIRFELLSGDVLELSRSRIVCVREVEGQRHEGEFWPTDPHATRLFFGPTGRALPGGQGYLSVFEIVMPMVAFGVTDRLTLAGGMPLIFTSDGIELLWLAPKLEVVRTPTFRGATGVLAFFSPGQSESIGILYGVGTLGRTSDQAVTLGAGWGYSTDSGIYEWPALMAGFENRLSRRVKLISENYLIPDESVGLVSLGTRFMGDRLSADLGLGLPLGVGEFFAFPLINFAYAW
jgi:hypothetical protein